MKILALGTYPVRVPLHGGQRRTNQIGLYYKAAGMEYRHACVYDARHYSADEVGPDDLPFGLMGGLYAQAPFIDDLASGAFAASHAAPYEHFSALIETWRPDVVQMEQPFMWPLVRRLRREGKLDGVVLVYSSHNVEGPLKRDILETAGVERRIVARVEGEIEAIEKEIVESSDMLISVSEADGVRYEQYAPGLERMVIRNGADRPGRTRKPEHGGELSAGEYLFFVGSAYPPNIDGYKRYVLSGGLYGFPPAKRFAICGGVADGLFVSDLYAPHAESYGDRVQFFGRPSDEELAWLRERAKGFLLPIDSGGGSNLKTAEALASAKWVIATSTALRSFEDFQGEKGVIVADTPEAFQDAMLDVTYGKPLTLTARQKAKREGLYWDVLLARSGLADRLKRLVADRNMGRDVQ